MFRVGLEGAIDWEDKGTLSKHLYRVQKLSGSNYMFRHHLASTTDHATEEVNIQSFKAWNKNNPIKVNISNLGKISAVL